MAKNTIGQFIAALRKANGLTQQNVADRLNVSNKAVSRWERDECAPDLSLIPALAEMFGVTCDELLKGERISGNAQTEKKAPKIDKQVKALVNRTLAGFKTLIWISLAVAIVGLVCMFGISYGFYRPVIGFTVMLLFEACAFVLAVLAVGRTRDVKSDNELFEMADAALVERYDHTLGSLSFTAFFMILAAIMLSFPLVLASSDYVNSVITLYSYFVVFFGWIVLLLVLIWLKCREPYMAWIAGVDVHKAEPNPAAGSRKRMTCLQVGATILASFLFIVAPYFSTDPMEVSPVQIALVTAGLACLVANFITFLFFMLREKAQRKELALPGVRNILFILCALILSQAHDSYWIGTPAVPGDPSSVHTFTWHDSWVWEYFWYAVALAGFFVIVFSIIETLRKKHAK